VDAKLLLEKELVMAAGTHEDALVVDAGEWAWSERVQPVRNLGVPEGRHA
jgi:hypothetical protein